MATFSETAVDKFSFLESEFDYELVSARDGNWGGEVIYANKTLGIRVIYEFSVAFIFVFICKLVDGKIVDNPRPIEGDSELHCFDFNDMLEAGVRMKSAYEYPPDSPYFDEVHGLQNFTEAFAVRLRRHGKGLLRGDLSVFPKMEKLIKERARQLQS